MTPADYLAWERTQTERHEYFRGEVFAMSGGTMRHSALGLRIGAALSAALPRCFVFNSDMRVGLDAGARYVYPDASAACGRAATEAGTDDVLLNPSIVVEVLSPSTEQYDRGLKWEGYQRIPSLTDYLLVSQAEVRIEHFRREAGGAWTYRAVGPGERVSLTGGVELAVDDVFAGIPELPAE